MRVIIIGAIIWGTVTLGMSIWDRVHSVEQAQKVNHTRLARIANGI